MEWNEGMKWRDAYPLSFLSLEFTEIKLQLLHCDAVTRQNTQHVHQQVWETDRDIMRETTDHVSPPQTRLLPPQSLTCDHVVRSVYPLQDECDETHVGAGLHVPHALLQNSREHAPHLGLTRHLTLIQQVHHTRDALRLLDNEVHLQVKLTADQLHRDGCRDTQRDVER